jgi:transcriptional regulator with XRE-family HTH domain
MPRAKQLPQIEIQTCTRIKLFRETTELPRRIFAKQASIDPSALARVELGRAPLKYGMAVRICDAFAVNPQWIASGDGRMDIGVALPRPASLGVSKSALFTEVFAAKLCESVQKKIQELERDPRFMFGEMKTPVDAKGRVVTEALLRLDMREWLTAVPDAKFQELVNRIRYAAMPLVYDWDATPGDLEQIEPRRLEMEVERKKLLARKEELTTRDESVTLNLVKTIPTMNALREALRKLLKQPGNRADLMKHLPGVPRESISRWLSGEREPGGDTTLQLLKWVELQERKTTK